MEGGGRCIENFWVVFTFESFLFIICGFLFLLLLILFFYMTTKLDVQERHSVQPSMEKDMISQGRS